MVTPRKFADVLFEYTHAYCEFEGRIEELIGLDFGRITGDWYDVSIELREVGNDIRLSEEAQRFIFDNGFIRCWLNHLDGSETYYVWPHDKPFAPSGGSRNELRKRA